MSEKVYVGLSAESVDVADEYLPISKVVVWYDDDNAFVAGDDSGRTIELDNPFATQATADAILGKLKGIVYKPYTAYNAFLNPAAEIGDAVTVGGVYSQLVSVDTTIDKQFASTISAPSDEELDHEYPYLTKQERELSRKVTLGKSYYGTRITRANGLEVVTTEADGTETARAMLNSDVLAFYDADGIEALYFDAVAKKYKFRGDVEITGGSINVNDNFIVYEDGSVVINGPLSITGDASFIQVRYSTNKSATIPSGWSETWNDAWSNTSTEVWAIYSYDRGTTWSDPILIQGKNGEQGEQGPAGSSASIPPWVAAYTASAQYNTLVTNEWVVTMNLYSSKIYGAAYYDPSALMKMELSFENTLPAFMLSTVYSDWEPIFYVWDDGSGTANVQIGGPTWHSLSTNYTYNGEIYANIVAEGRHKFVHEVVFDSTCNVIFNGATVTGLTATFA